MHNGCQGLEGAFWSCAEAQCATGPRQCRAVLLWDMPRGLETEIAFGQWWAMWRPHTTPTALDSVGPAHDQDPHPWGQWEAYTSLLI